MQEYPIIVLHGWGHTTTAWKRFADRFPEGLVQLFDLPGFGTEPLPDTGWGVPEYAAWVEEKIVESGKQNVILLGHSFGGRIAGLIASRQPSWLKAVILYGAPALYRPTLYIRARIALAKALKPLIKKRGVTTDLAQADAQGLGDVFRRVVPFDETEQLPHIAVPTLLVWGAYDTDAPVRIAQEAQTLIPGSTLKIMPKTGHNAHLEQPELFYGIIKRFIEAL